MTRREAVNVLRYALYDAGNSNYDTLVVSLGFSIFLERAVLTEPGRADAAWGVMLALATVAAAVAGFYLGNFADRRRAKLLLLRATAFTAIAGTVMIGFLPHGRLWLTGAVFVVTQTSFLLACLLYDSALADVSSPENAATVSSVAWGVGYLGGLVGLLVAARTTGIEPVAARLQALFLIAAGLYLVLALPMLTLRARPSRAAAPTPHAGLVAIFREFMRSPLRLRLFFAFFLYMNGVNAVIYFTARFAEKTLHYGLDEIITLFVALNLAAAPAAVILGRIGQKLGEVRMLRLVVAGWMVVVAVICVIGWKQDKTLFAVAVCCAATLLGPVQALSRSLFRIIFPEEAMSSFFAVQSLANRSAGLIGPLLFGALSWATGSQIVGAASASLLFGLGLLVLFTVPANVTARAARR